MSAQKTSKFLSLILRHKPEAVGISLDAQGWVAVDLLLSAMQEHGHQIDRALLDQIVADDEKQRYSIEQGRIRANQGHSLPVNLELAEKTPPAELFHGTSLRRIDQILQQGILKMNRHHVHLSSDHSTACKVGRRHGKPVILKIDAEAMYRRGFRFYQSENGVWLVDQVPTIFLEVLNNDA